WRGWGRRSPCCSSDSRSPRTDPAGHCGGCGTPRGRSTGPCSFPGTRRSRCPRRRCPRDPRRWPRPCPRHRSPPAPPCPQCPGEVLEEAGEGHHDEGQALSILRPETARVLAVPLLLHDLIRLGHVVGIDGVFLQDVLRLVEERLHAREGGEGENRQHRIVLEADV